MHSQANRSQTRLERSEKMKLPGQEPQAYETTGHAEESLLNLREPIQPTPQSAVGMQPGYRPLDEPSKDAEAAAMLRLALAKHRRDSHQAQQLPGRFGVIATIALQSFRFLPPGASLAAHGRHCGQEAKQLRDLVDVRCCHGRGQGNTLAIGHQVVLAAQLAPIRGIWASIFTSFRCLGERSVNQGSL